MKAKWLKESRHLKTLGARLRFFLLREYGQQIIAAQSLGVAQSSLSDLCNNKAEPCCRTLVKLLKKTEIDLHWLLTGKVI